MKSMSVPIFKVMCDRKTTLVSNIMNRVHQSLLKPHNEPKPLSGKHMHHLFVCFGNIIFCQFCYPVNNNFYDFPSGKNGRFTCNGAIGKMGGYKILQIVVENKQAMAIKTANNNDFSTPAFVVDERLLSKNLSILSNVKARTNCRILLAQKAFSMFSVYPLLRQALDGCCASSVHEARLAREEFGGEVHAFAAAFSEAEMVELATLIDGITFNSFNQ